jgi:hypothetical protein
MVRESVVHATAESIWRNGLRETGRGRRHAGAAAARLLEAHVRVGDLGLGLDVGHCLRLHGDRLGAELEPGHADPAAPALAVARDLAVLDLDPSEQLVGLAEEVPLVPIVEVVEASRKWLVVMGQAHVEGHGQESLDGLEGNPRNRGDRTFKFHLSTSAPQLRAGGASGRWWRLASLG